MVEYKITTTNTTKIKAVTITTHAFTVKIVEAFSFSGQKREKICKIFCKIDRLLIFIKIMVFFPQFALRKRFLFL